MVATLFDARVVEGQSSFTPASRLIFIIPFFFARSSCTPLEIQACLSSPRVRGNIFIRVAHSVNILPLSIGATVFVTEEVAREAGRAAVAAHGDTAGASCSNMQKHGSRSIVRVTAGGWNIPDTPSHRHSKYSRQATTEFDGRADWRQTHESGQPLIIHCHVRESRFSKDASPDDVWAAIRRPLFGCGSAFGTRRCVVRCHSNQGPAARCNDGWRVRWVVTSR